MVVHWHKLGEVVNECTIHNNIVLAIFVLKIIEVCGNLSKLCQKQFWLFLRHGVVTYTRRTSLKSVFCLTDRVHCCWLQIESIKWNTHQLVVATSTPQASRNTSYQPYKQPLVGITCMLILLLLAQSSIAGSTLCPKKNIPNIFNCILKTN